MKTWISDRQGRGNSSFLAALSKPCAWRLTGNLPGKWVFSAVMDLSGMVVSQPLKADVRKTPPVPPHLLLQPMDR